MCVYTMYSRTQTHKNVYLGNVSLKADATHVSIQGWLWRCWQSEHLIYSVTQGRLQGK